MKFTDHKIWLSAVAIALASATLFWAQSRGVNYSTVPTNLESAAGAGESEPEVAGLMQSEPQELAEPAGISEKGSEPFSPSRNGQDANNAEILVHRQGISNSIESALAGSVEDASKVLERFRTCTGAPTDEAGLQMMLQTYAAQPELPMRTPNGLLGGFEQFESFEGWSAAETQRFRACNATKSLFGEDLRTRLRERAESGDVLARFMYAMLPPRNIERNPDRVLIWLEYVDLAYEFTTQNMDENEPLGLLAMGLSLRGLGVFTPREPLVGSAFLIAAERCGAPQVLLDLIGIRYTDGAFRTSWADSEAIVREFCK